MDQALSGTTGQRPNQVLADPYATNKNVSRWLNPAAFAMPALGTYGNTGSQNVRIEICVLKCRRGLYARAYAGLSHPGFASLPATE